MSKVKLMVDENNADICLRMTEFFKSQDIDFEIAITENNIEEQMQNIQGDTVEVDLDVTGAGSVKTRAGKALTDFVGPVSRKKLDERISNIFITVGIPAHIKGYQFLREAVKLTIEKPDIINSITKQLYPSIAKRFGTTPSKVERAIRHAIEVGWNRGRVDLINNIFGVRAFDIKDKPTNGEFIAIVADKMILEGA